MAGAETEFQAWKQQQGEAFKQYRDEVDREFAEFLKTRWREFEIYKGTPLYEQPKPKTVPTAPEPVKEAKERGIEPTVKPLAPQAPAEQAAAPTPPSLKESVSADLRAVAVNFFGSDIQFLYDSKIQRASPRTFDSAAIAAFWSVLATSDYAALLNQLAAQRAQLKLNDWGYVLLTNKLARKLYPKTQNEQQLFTWFVLLKSGYKARVGYRDNRVFLLLPVLQDVYAVQSISYNNTKFYLLDFSGGSAPKIAQLYSYDGKYPAAEKIIDMRLRDVMRTKAHYQKRKLTFKFQGKTYEVDSQTDQQIVKFYKTYPQVDWSVYFEAPVTPATETQILDRLRPWVAQYSEQEAVNLLLRFVQTAFKYATDETQFGFEKPLFPEETLFYAYSDCEDRAVMFAWLVRELLGLKVVGLRFPGHLATAVRLTKTVPGEFVTFHGEKYIICDPTYTNANAGMLMPQLQNSKPQFIKITRKPL